MLISLYSSSHSTPRSRILIKIPATPAGIAAAHILEQEGIHTNMTLVFTVSQAIACAEAGVSVISPFVGRVKDWYEANGKECSEHPGLVLVSLIKQALARGGYLGKTEVMAAGFREPEELIHMISCEALHPPDLVTIPVNMQEKLKGMVLPAELRPKAPELPMCLECEGPAYFDGCSTTPLYDQILRRERIALDKVKEGLQRFSTDAGQLEEIVRSKMVAWNM